ncbi:MAG: TonB-dependent receptor [Parabacteroides distasonis]|jgi:outer membrane cobalamin receptor|uniref:TonB-dependent receptor plug domain-containing protein n=1 Tax=Parabacteroides distasonis TaxID=823 RepID=A0A7K0HHB1_PARDI|nr:MULTISPECIES: TonB-dependent receptor [Parabacteroides]MBS7099758.1 TonB-dependent receptor [Parabacteroides sp.]MBT9663043.1 TonB-dependent receptor plug domain-containing protein [Parabacteroides distasonis]MCB7022165.1 carboxypeptidase-like regulatory domain-containing protein [Parabacteroides distasonis]MCE8843806.1 carboxypeptidase-like regulatory domain-containing protein [Parabacteroides distasonis]MCE9022844.1 carboxypeptidase-like regulatory domain-containing protein [Parabacteroid
MMMKKIRGLFLSFLLLLISISAFSQHKTMISGKVLSTEKTTVDFATVYLKGTNYGGTTNEEGIYHLQAPAGEYTLVVSAIGYKTVEKPVKLMRGERTKMNVVISPQATELDEVVVVSNGVTRLKRSAFNAVALDTKALQNSTQNLSEALAQAPGMKIRESGGVGSDMQLMMDGFTGKHIKIFIDGVPQEGVGSSFGLNNIPVNYAERIEVYKGVVPVGFGTDAIGGVINIITKKNRDKWFLDASYSYGSFNTHKSYVNFGQTFRSGLTYEINVFQNYSDNNYYVDTPVKDFTTGAINKKKIEHVKRFHDTYHNEAVIGKIGFVDKKWADRLMFGFTYSHMYKDIQTGVRQEVVFGGKYRKGYSIMPSLDYRKRDFFVRGLDLVLTANYNKNMTNNVDTSSYEYNWRGEMRPLRMPGEQSYQNTRSDNNNWNGTLTANYRIGKAHTFTFNHVINAFRRSNQSLLNEDSEANAIPKETRKNISGLSYRLMPTEHWNLSVFGKYYNQFIAGPVATSSAQDDYIRTTNSVSAMGYGAAGTYFILKSLQAKLSYEKAYRLPTNEEMFGDEDLETGDISLKPENSDNVNLNLSYNETFGKHSVYVEGGLIYRNTKDYIQRNISDLSGGKYGATYVNHGRVETKGYNISVRYGFANWVSVGGNFTQMNVRDNVKTVTSGTNQESLTYGARMPNLPYQFANSDVTFYWRNLWKKGNTLSVTYDNLYMHSFPLYSEAVGSESEFVVPTQFSHNLTLSYGIQNGRYNISFECRNLTNEKLYDNFSLQKAGRAFYGKVRVYFGN